MIVKLECVIFSQSRASHVSLASNHILCCSLWAEGADWDIIRAYVCRQSGKSSSSTFGPCHTPLYIHSGADAVKHWSGADSGKLTHTCSWLIDWYMVINRRAGRLFNHRQSLWTLITATILPVAVSAHYNHSHLPVWERERDKILQISKFMYTHLTLSNLDWFVFLLLLPSHPLSKDISIISRLSQSMKKRC